MTRRIAASMSLVAFLVCIVTGLQAGNPFNTVVSKAMIAMAVTFVVGLILGGMAQKMLDEETGTSGATSLNPEKNPNPQTKTETSGR
jgi:hypothetical protein